jgi:hypothetical protein
VDIAAGLAAASQTLTILKQIRELDASIDSAAFKAKLLEIQESAHDARVALLEAKEAVLAKNEEIAELKRQLRTATSGEGCPVCCIGTLDVTRITAHPKLGKVGIQEKHLVCGNPECSHTESRLHDPVGILDKG